MNQRLRNALSISILLIPLLCGCHIENACKTGGDEITTVENAKGTLTRDSDYKDYYIRYFIPGSIDSSYRGFVCDDDLANISIEDDMTVIFSGTFRETDDYQNVTFTIGGETIARLSLTAIQATVPDDEQ